MKEASLFEKGKTVLQVSILLSLLVLGTAYTYNNSCTVEPAELYNQQVQNGSLYVDLVQEPGLVFEGETEKLEAQRYEPVAIRWCPTLNGERVRGVYTR